MPHWVARRFATSLRRDLALMVVAFAALRIYAVAGLEPERYGDTHTYFPLVFLGDSQRLWTVPLLFNLLTTDGLRVAGHVALAIGSWSTLAVIVAGIPRNAALARVGAAAMLLVGLAPQVTQCDVAMLSESAGISLSVLTVAAFLHLVRNPGAGRFAFLLTALMFWAFARHINVFVLLAATPLALVLVLRRVQRPLSLVVAGALVLLCVWGTLATRGNSVWKLNSYSILTARVLPDAEATAFFTRHGLRVTDEMRRDQKSPRGAQSPGFRDPATQDFIERRWRRAYPEYLLRRPVATLREPVYAAADHLSGDPDLAEPRAVAPAPLQGAVWPTSGGAVPFCLAAAIALWLASWWRDRGAAALDAAAAALIVLSGIWYLMVYHLSAFELIRLSLPVSATLRVSVLLLALLAADRLIDRRTA